LNNAETPSWQKGDGYLGKGNGIESRLASVVNLQSIAKTKLDETRIALKNTRPAFWRVWEIS
jgi:hypothetical protein